MRRWLSWPKAHDWKSCVRGTVPRVRIPLSAPTLRATAQSMPQKRQERNKVPPVAFCVKPHASPCAPLRRIGHRNSDASLHSAIPSLRSLRIPLSAPTLQAWLEANQKSGRTAQAPLPFLFALLPTLSAPLRSIGNRNSDASLHSAIPSLRSLQIPLSAPTLRATAQSMPQKRQERNKFPLSLFVSSPMPRPALR